MPRISVIIPTYNRARLVGEAIDSVLAQTYQDFEIIVVDDGSTDDTGEVLRKYADRIHYIYQENGGHCAARNTGLAHARGEYIAFLDSDDLFLPRKLEVQLKGFQQCPGVGMVYSKSFSFDDRPESRSVHLGESDDVAAEMQDIFEEILLMRKAPLIHETLVRRDCFDEVGGFDEKLATAGDHSMWLRIAASYSVAFVDATVAGYRQHGDQLSSSGRRQGQYVADLEYILGKIAADLPAIRRTPQVYQSIARARALLDFEKAGHAFLAEGEGGGIEQLRQCLDSAQLLKEDGGRILGIVVNYCNAFDGVDATCSKSIELLHVVWDNLPPKYHHLRRRLRQHMAFRHHDRACLALKDGQGAAALVEAMRWLRYREPWRAPTFIERALASRQASPRRSRRLQEQVQNG